MNALLAVIVLVKVRDRNSVKKQNSVDSIAAQQKTFTVPLLSSSFFFLDERACKLISKGFSIKSLSPEVCQELRMFAVSKKELQYPEKDILFVASISFFGVKKRKRSAETRVARQN